MDCIFCKIAKGEIPVDFIYQTPSVAVFKDLEPQAKFHFLVIPKIHIENLNELKDPILAADLVLAIQNVTKKLGIKEYRTVINTGEEAGQSVFHLHIHILSGRKMLWPPG